MDPKVYPWLWPAPEPPSLDEVTAGAAGAQSHWKRFGFGLWLLRDRGTSQVVGRGGLRWATPVLPNVEVAWAIISPRWGEGLATELAHESLRMGFEELEVDEIVAYTIAENHASRRVMEKAGLSYERELVVEQLPHVLYRRRR